MLNFFREHQRDVYKQTIELTANARRLRPVFLSRKSKEERHRLIQQYLGSKPGEPAAGNLLQAWFSGAQGPMLSDFLDALDVPHDEKGLVEELPSNPDPVKLGEAVKRLLAKYPFPLVRVYLQTFQVMNEERWEELDQLLERLDTLAEEQEIPTAQEGKNPASGLDSVGENH